MAEVLRHFGVELDQAEQARPVRAGVQRARATAERLLRD
jgi:hypothetical protein